MTEFLEKLVTNEEGDGDSTWSEFQRKPATIAYSAGDFDLNDLMRLHCLMKKYVHGKESRRARGCVLRCAQP